MTILGTLVLIALSGLALAFAFGLFLIWVINTKYPEYMETDEKDIYW